MLKDISGIRICGANFNTATDLMILNPRKDKKNKMVRGSLIYGRNGAGKSTIAKAVKKIKGETQETINHACFLDQDDSPVELTEAERDRVFVFDEDYVDKNIKMHESGLDTIIMLGQQVELASRIEEQRKKLEKVREEYEKQEAVVIEYENSESTHSPKYHKNRMRWALQGDACWAGRDKEIRGNRQNTRVNDDTYKQFINNSTKKTRDQLLIEYNEKLKELRIAQHGDAAIRLEVPTFDYDYDEGRLSLLLKTKIEKPELSDREKYLLDIVQSGKSAELNDIASIFADKSVCRCPKCLQPVTEEYKQDLVNSIQKVLNKKVEEHQESLREFIRPEIELDLTLFNRLTNANRCSSLLLRINRSIKNNNIVVSEKIDNPYTPCEKNIEPVSNLVNKLISELEKLEKERTEYNSVITATGPIVEKLIEINSQIANLDIQDHYLEYLACKSQLHIERVRKTELKETYLDVKNNVEALEAKQKNVKVALSIINDNLSYIFFSADRFRIEYREGNYTLLSNGNSVRPSQISQGERNIIGLCYFFANIMQNQEEESAYTREYLIFIDDPVSSFDIENRIGIMSFLKYQLGRFYIGNENTRVVIMTHDLLTYYDCDKVMSALVNIRHEKTNGERPYHRGLELRNKELITFQHRNRQEYTELLKIIYDFAQGKACEYEIVIGNIMRQMLEAFSTFQYKKGIGDISTDPDILAELPEETFRRYFEGLMYRLILNNGSHRQEQTESMSDMNFLSVISTSEKQRTAKEILCFVYLLNKKHLLSHLNGCPDAEENIKRWCTEIKKMMGQNTDE